MLHICVTGNVPSITHLVSRVDSFHIGTRFPKYKGFDYEHGTQDAVLVDYYK